MVENVHQEYLVDPRRIFEQSEGTKKIVGTRFAHFMPRIELFER
jgi:hypothetical protein